MARDWIRVADELYRARSDFHDITVTDEDGVVTLRFSGKRQSSMEAADGLDSHGSYVDYFHVALALSPDAKTFLFIGLGGGVLPKQVWHDYPEAIVDVVELDPTVVEVARRFFGLPRDDRFRVHVGEGRSYLENATATYDVIIVDAYFDRGMPFVLATAEFLAVAASRLSSAGVLGYNIIGAVDDREEGTLNRFLAGMDLVLPATHVIPTGVECGGGRQNICILGTRSVVPHSDLIRRIRDRVGGKVRIGGFEAFADHVLAEPPRHDRSRPFRDSESPPGGMLEP